MRQAGELKFNPIQFDLCTTNGLPGTKGTNDSFFHSALSQNIAYCVRKDAKTAAEIADTLGVSPVYVESEADYLAEYGFLTEKSGRYLCNILLDEPSSELIALRDKVYGKAAALFANDLFDELTRSGIVSDPRIECGQTVPAPDSAGHARADDNFILWSLIPYIAAHSGEAPAETNVSFEEAAAMRPDGGLNICHASVAAPNGKQPMYYESMQHLRGPCWNQNQEFLLWQMDSEWSSIRVTDGYMEKAKRILSILSRCKKAVTIRLVRRILPFLKRTELQRGNLTAAKEKRSLYSFPGWFGWKAAR